MSPPKVKPWRLAGHCCIAGGFLLHLTLGTLYCFGNMNTYMTSYLRTHVPAQANQHYSDAVWIPTLATLGQGLFMPLSGYLEDRVGVRITVLVGCTLMSSGVFLTYFTIQQGLGLTTLSYGLLFGLGLSLAYAPPMGAAMRWFPRQKGLVNGIIVAGFGLGAFIFNQVQTAYLNPNNLSLDADGYFTNPVVLQRVPSVFLLLGSIYTVMQLVSVLLISAPDEEHVSSAAPLVVTSALDDEDIIYETERQANSPDMGSMSSYTNMQVSQPHLENVKPGQIVKTPEFWILWFTFLFNTQAVGYINTMYKAFGQTFIDDDHFLAIVGAFAAVFNSSGRVFWGHLCDVFGYKMCMTLVTVCISLLYSTLYFSEYGGKALYAVWICAIFFSFCGNFVLLPTASALCFGTKYSSKNYGLVMTGSAAAAPILAILTQGLSPIVGYLGMFILIACCSAIATVLTTQFPACPSPRKILERLDRTRVDL